MKLKSLIASVALTVAAATAAQSAVVVNIWEDGSDVRVRAAGTLDLSGITLTNPAGGGAFLSGTSFVLGDPEPSIYTAYTFNIPSNPNNFGGVRFNRATSSAGSRFSLTTGDVAGGNTIVRVATDYQFGDELLSTALFENRTISTMGLTLGTFIFALPSSDTVTINVGTAPSAVPLPAGAFLMLGGLGAFGALRYKTKRSRQKA